MPQQYDFNMRTGQTRGSAPTRPFRRGNPLWLPPNLWLLACASVTPMLKIHCIDTYYVTNILIPARFRVFRSRLSMFFFPLSTQLAGRTASSYFVLLLLCCNDTPADYRHPPRKVNAHTKRTQQQKNCGASCTPHPSPTPHDAPTATPDYEPHPQTCA